MNTDEIIKQLQDELEQTKQELNLTKEHLKKVILKMWLFA